MDRQDAIVAIGSAASLLVLVVAEAMTSLTCAREEAMQIEEAQASIGYAIEELQLGLGAIPLALVARERKDAEWAERQARTIRRHLVEAMTIIESTLDEIPEP